jgi:hypothetical protein
MWEFHPPDGRFFSQEQRRQLGVLFEALLPGDDDSPGAGDVDAVEYIDRLLAMEESTYYEIAAWKVLYRQALPALDGASAALHGGRGVAGLTPDEAAGLLAGLAEGTLPGVGDGIDQKTVFATLRSHCIEGCFADPRWGGNRDGAMWRWYGYLEPPQEFHRQGPPATSGTRP